MWNPYFPTPQTQEPERQKVAIYTALAVGRMSPAIWPKFKRLMKYICPNPRTLPLDGLDNNGHRLETVVRRFRFTPYRCVRERLEGLLDIWNRYRYGWDFSYLYGKRGFSISTAHYVGLYTQPNALLASVDRHIWVWLRTLNHRGLPNQRPTRWNDYRPCQDRFLDEACRRELRPWELDRKVWFYYQQRHDHHKTQSLLV